MIVQIFYSTLLKILKWINLFTQNIFNGYFNGYSTYLLSDYTKHGLLDGLSWARLNCWPKVWEKKVNTSSIWLWKFLNCCKCENMK